MKFKNFLPAISWLIISTILLCLPGDDLPHAPLFSFPYFDKYVHFGMFTILVALFCIPFARSGYTVTRISQWFITIALYALAFGVAMEFVQKYLVPNRSFDLFDILFDGLGAATGAVVMWQWYKKIGPDRNRGRNQN
jgi:VanZ family protein